MPKKEKVGQVVSIKWIKIVGSAELQTNILYTKNHLRNEENTAP